MPIYEYKCGDCGAQQDHLQKHTDPAIKSCPACGSSNYGKQLTAAGFQLKGSGWYATDFKGAACPAKAADPAPSSPPPCAGNCACH